MRLETGGVAPTLRRSGVALLAPVDAAQIPRISSWSTPAPAHRSGSVVQDLGETARGRPSRARAASVGQTEHWATWAFSILPAVPVYWRCTVIVWFVGRSNQSEVHVFCGDLRSAARRKQCVGEFLAAVRFREPPRSGINQGEALHRSEVRLTLAQDGHSGQALPVRDHSRAARGSQDRLIAITEHRGS